MMAAEATQSELELQMNRSDDLKKKIATLNYWTMELFCQMSCHCNVNNERQTLLAGLAININIWAKKNDPMHSMIGTFIAMHLIY